MDSLVANYASSDEDDEQQQRQSKGFTFKLPESSSSSSTSSSSKVSSLFSSLPQPKQSPKSPIDQDVDLKSSSSREKSSSLFTSLPQPKSSISIQSGSISDPAPKRIVQFKLPVNPRPSNLDGDEDDEDDEEKERKKRKQMEASAQDSSLKSFLSKMPAPKNSATLGVLSSSSLGRRSIMIETEAPSTTLAESGIDQSIPNNANYQSVNKLEENSIGDNANYQAINYQNEENYVQYESGMDQNTENYTNYYANYGGYDQSAGASVGASGYGGYDNSYVSYVGHGDQYGNSWANGSEAIALPETLGAMDSAVKRAKRGKNEIPAEIVEVKQDELMKNRPREDQVKLTGIAFGPSYQPASSKGKPSKLHKRKHQISALYYDMKQKEMELAERRSRGLLTKSETQAKYGW